MIMSRSWVERKLPNYCINVLSRSQMFPACILFLLSTFHLINYGNAIADGQGASETKYFMMNHMVTLRPVSTDKHSCAGIIYLQGEWILTARSCLLYKGTRSPQIMHTVPATSRYMQFNKNSTHEMLKSFCHPFIKDQPNVQTDVGLIKLENKLNIIAQDWSKDIIEAKLVQEDFNFANHYDKENVQMSGWGSLDPAKFDIRDQSAKAIYSMREPSVCESDELSRGFKHPNHICLRNWANTNPTHGDEGGPATYFYYAHHRTIGIIPSIPPNGDWQPFVMNLSYFREFIDDVVRHEPPEYECRNQENATKMI